MAQETELTPVKPGTVKILAILVILLFGVLYVLNTTDRYEGPRETELLAPELKPRLNDVTEVEIATGTDADDRVLIVRGDDLWQVSGKDGYPADTAKLRELLRALADARKIEPKTANPELYARLRVAGPGQKEGAGKLVTARAPEVAFSVILGDSAQGDYRYARLPDEAQSWLIDRNPALPDDATGWLLRDIVDIKSADVRSVVIRHADGETIRLHKESADAGTFTVEEIPEGRELSYPTVVNGIAGALGNLTLDDVARAEEGGLTAATQATFETFDGLRVEVTAADIDEQTWITLEASAPEAAEAAQPAAEEESPDETPGGDATDDEIDAGDDAVSGAAPDDAAPADADTAEEDAAPSPAERAAAISERTAGWRYRIPGYKADQLTRRWEDILKAEDEE